MNSFGRQFRISIFGESHQNAIGILIDGCPAGISLSEKDFEEDIERRKPNQTGTTSRKETDIPYIKSGVYQEKTTGAPILIEFENNNIRSKDYSQLEAIPRPGHSDYAASVKYKQFNDLRGGGHFSGRLTLALVAAGVIAKKLIPTSISIKSKILEIGGSEDYSESIKTVQKQGDSLGGIIECQVTNMPVGLGEPFFDSVESQISHLVFSIPGIKGIEFGSGFKGGQMYGSEFNDAIINAKGTTQSNHSGGINGGISNGNDLIFRVAVRPTASIGKAQNTYNFKTQKIEELKIRGRHDTCFALRVPVVLEAVTAIVLADFHLIERHL